MGNVLFLCHRLPWPPNKGDKIRSYHVLRRLAEHHRVYLGTFVDDPADWRYLDAVMAVCADACIRPLRPLHARWRALGSFIRGDALTVGVYRDRVLRRWVDGLVESGRVDMALCYSSGMAPFVLRHQQLPRVMDFVDADSDKWRQYAQAAHGLMRWVYRREAQRLDAFERDIAARFDASLFVSEAEADFFRRQSPTTAGKVHGIPNGVDCDYWNPARACPMPYPAGERILVFAGAMDYRANIDAVRWFAAAVWPRIRALQPAARFYVVGSNPAAAVQALAAQDGIVVTGRVEDVRPYVAHAHVSVAPLRIARGIQNKVLEALAMEKPVLATPEAWEGIGDFEGRAGCISAAPAEHAAAALHWLESPQPRRVPAARAHVLARFSWSRNLDAYEAVLRQARPAGVATAAMDAARLEACP